MKKILFLLLICVIKLSAYEYLFFDNYDDSTSYTAKYRWFTDSSGNLKVKQQLMNGGENIIGVRYEFLKFIRINDSHYISNLEFKEIYSKDLNFLDDLYIQYTNQFLNYLYNESNFNDWNHVVYDNYELLYNSDGLAVESIVNGKWAGLYDDSGQSGNLYNEKGDLIYVNGVSASFFEKINNKLLRKFKINLESIFIKKIFYPLLVLIFVCVILRLVIRMAFQAFLIRFYDKKISQLEKRRENIENA